MIYNKYIYPLVMGVAAGGLFVNFAHIFEFFAFGIPMVWSETIYNIVLLLVGAVCLYAIKYQLSEN